MSHIPYNYKTLPLFYLSNYLITLIIHTTTLRPRPLPVESVRYIANAAGGLLPVLAQSLKDTFFRATILTSYGMTEW